MNTIKCQTEIRLTLIKHQNHEDLNPLLVHLNLVDDNSCQTRLSGVS